MHERGRETASGEIKTLETTFRILETLDELDRENVTGLEDELDVANSTIYDHVKTLQRHGYVVKDGEEYRLGLKFLELGYNVREQFAFYTVAEAELEKLAEATGERVNLVVEENGDAVFLDITRGEEAVYQDLSVGSRGELHCTSAGKALLAYQPEERIERLLESMPLEAKTSDTITDPEELRTNLRDVHDRGFALDLEERHEGLQCVGAPIKDSDGVAVASVSVSGPVSRLSEERLLDDVAKQVTETANVIEINSMYL